MASFVTCGDNDEVHTLSSTQCPQKHQKMISEALQLPACKVVCKTKRLVGRCMLTLSKPR